MIEKQQLPTHNIANKGFSDMRRFVTRFNFSCNLIVKKPAIPYWPYCQPLPLHDAEMYNKKALKQ